MDDFVADLLPLELRQWVAPIAAVINTAHLNACRFETPSKSDVLAWWEKGMPRNLVPVVMEKNDGFADYYCLNLESGSPVVVFCDHAIVAGWDSIESFLTWLKLQM